MVVVQHQLVAAVVIAVQVILPINKHIQTVKAQQLPALKTAFNIDVIFRVKNLLKVLNPEFIILQFISFMKILYVLLIGLLVSISAIAQKRPQTIISPFVDTTFSGFKEIYQLWESYLDELNHYSARQSYILNNFPDPLQKYWDQKELELYDFPDLLYSFKRGYGNVFYPMEKEYLLGIVKRNEYLFELRSMFIFYPEEVWKGIPSYIITVPVKQQTDGGFKLANAFTSHKSKLQTKRLGLIRYYYDRDYEFNTEKALAMQTKIQAFNEGFGIVLSDSITYILSNNMTVAAEWFGVQHFDMDFLSGLSYYEARALKTNNMVISGGMGEDHFHEIIHLMLAKLNISSMYHWYEEGIATYFGGSLTHEYSFHVRRLKTYLHENPWIDLSGSFSGYYYDENNGIHFGNPPEGTSYNRQYFNDAEMKSNYIYTIHAAIVDIAFRLGGYATVKELFLCKADNEDQFYNCIEEVLKIKRADMNTYLRNFINTNY
ncbi:MAG: hypothetical protein H0S78_04310 [Tissierellales bacterium]|nr:hypothetical protein [Tissierellales bacterium]